MIRLIPIEGIGRITPGDDLAGIFSQKLKEFTPFSSSDCIVVASKVVAKAMGQIVKVESTEEKKNLVISQSKRILRTRGDLIISETNHGFICANAGIDESNTEPDTAVLLPNDLDKAAHSLRNSLLEKHKMDLAVIISDTFGRPFRKGEVNVALGISGLRATVNLAGKRDFYSKDLKSTNIAIADEIASAAELVMHKSSGICLALVRGLPESYRGSSTAKDLIRNQSEDLFR